MNRKSFENIVVPNKIIFSETKHSFLCEWCDYRQKQQDFSNDELYRDLDNKYSDIIHNFEKYNEQYFNDKFRCITKVFGRDKTYKDYCIFNYNWYRKMDNERRKIYYQEHKEEIKEKEKVYRKANKEKINENRKLYREQNRDKIIEQLKKHREETLIQCPCGGRYQNVETKKTRHLQTKLHQKYLETKQ